MLTVELHGFDNERAEQLRADIIQRSANKPHTAELLVTICETENGNDEEPFIKLKYTWRENHRAPLHILQSFDVVVRCELIGEPLQEAKVV